jgi:hypothetical protein
MGKTRRWRGPVAAATALLAGAAGLLTAAASISPAQATAKASAPPTAWGVVQRIPDLDADAGKDVGSGESIEWPGEYSAVDFNVVSCTKPGYCTAGGDFIAPPGHYADAELGWVATESGGAWTPPEVIRIGVGNPPSGSVTAVSCASPGNCAAVGYDGEDYDGYVYHYGAFVLDEVNGKWNAPRQIPGTEALNPGFFDSGRATSVSCSAPGDCAVAGVVKGSQEFADTETNGVWGTAQLVPGTKTLGAAGPAISCPKPGDCTLASSQLTPTLASVTSVATETNGVWGTAAPLPGYAAAHGAVTSLSCRAVGDCSAAGWTTRGKGGKDTVPFVASEVKGIWTSQGLPGFAKLSPASVNLGAVTTVSCASAGNCSAGGWYRPTAGDTNVFLVNQVHGVWQTAKPVAGVAKTTKDIGVSGVSCPAAGDCAATVDRAGVGYVVQQASGTWAPARLILGTTGSSAPDSTGDSPGGASAVSCGAPGVCVTGGRDHHGTEAWVLERGSSAATLTSTSPSAAMVAYGKESAEKITVTVTATTPTPAGEVTVTANGRAVCTVTLKNGRGSCQLTARQLKAGTYKVAARYHSAVPYAASTSAAKTLKVTR